MLKNQFWSLTLDLNILRVFGFLVPGNHSPLVKKLLWAYWFFWVVFINQIYIIIQCGDLLIIWGDLPLMVKSSFLLFTNLAFAVKIAIFRYRRAAVLTIIGEGEQELRDENRAEGRAIIDESSRETAQQVQFYLLIAVITTGGWMASAEKNSLPSRAWYPYDEYRSPAYEITYVHQVKFKNLKNLFGGYNFQCMALVLIAAVNISMDSIITSLMAVCRCRLRLLNLSLRTLCTELVMKDKHLLSPDQEKIVRIKLQDCIMRHQAALRSADEIQACFMEPILAQFTVSMIIICVSAYELAVCMALVLIAAVNISMDSIITSLMAVCRCRLRLLNLSLRTLCTELVMKDKHLLSPDQEKIVRIKLQDCIMRHQAALRSADEIQACFMEPILAQFTVSMIIICVSAYELAVNLHSDSKNIVKIIATVTYLIGMILQVFLYCYQGDQLSYESAEISYAAYQCEWYQCSLRLRRDLLVVMVRTRRVAKVTAGGFSTLCLACFASIIKASYTFFTVLQQVEDR